MNLRKNLFLPALLLFAACGGDHDDGNGATSSHPLGGGWALESGADAEGTNLTFNAGGDEVSVHLPPREDGTHGHASGTYTFDEKTGAVTVEAAILGRGKGDSWAGKLDGEHLELASGETKLVFHHGSDPHGH